jgi:AAHS family 4-hydroxybenzoate transporter-like MFS transporter
VLAAAFVCATSSLASFGHLAGKPALAWLSLSALFVTGTGTGGAMLGAPWLPPRVFEAVARPVAIAAVSVCALAVYRARHPATPDGAAAAASGEPRTSGA